MPKLTVAAVRKYSATSKRREIPDAMAPGLHLVIQPRPSGTRSWALRCLREMRPPFSPAAVVESFVQVLRLYQCWTVRGDRWAGEWVREPLLTHGVSYELSELSKSEIYQAFMPMMNSRTVALLDNDRLERQLVALERRVSRGGRDSIDHPPGGHDDLANVAAGACLTALEHGAAVPMHRLQAFAINTHDPLASAEENALAAAHAEQRSGYFTGPGWAPTWHSEELSQQAYGDN